MAVFEKKEKNTVYFNFELDSKEFEKAVDKVYMRNRSRFNIPGFRKGKVPKKIIDLNYGEDFFYEDALNELLPEAYDAAIEELEIYPVDRPNIEVGEIVKSENIVLNVNVDVKPEVNLGDYNSIKIEKTEYNVTDEMIDSELEAQQEKNARIVDAGDREVKSGDILSIDYKGFVGEEQFEGGTAENQELEIGSNMFIPGFEDQLIGKKKGEEVDVNVTFPEEYHSEDLEGKDAVFKVTIHEIKEKELPEIDDEFAKDISEFDTIEEYRNDIKSNLEETYEQQEQVDLENKIVEFVSESAEVDIPNGMIESQVQQEIGEFEYRIGMQGLSLEQYLQFTGGNMDALKEELRPVAEKRVKADLVLESIAEAENIEVTEEDIDAELLKLAEQYKQDDKQKFVDDMKKGDLDFIKLGIRNTKVLELLKDKVEYVEE